MFIGTADKEPRMTRPVDDVGRVVIPIEVRRKLNLYHGCPVEVSYDGSIITIKKLANACILCGSLKDVELFKDKGICPVCREQFKTG